ncbi:MAG: hypothetical protein KF865_00190 [Bdellovibrionaceae bacterium]|nr:hypothetical protein [Pseudobdellovibrionaceae bacterium]
MSVPLLVLLAASAQAQALRCEAVFVSAAAASAPAFDARASWGRQLFERELRSAGEFFARTRRLNENQRMDALMGENIRRVFYRLQGLADVYRAHHPEFFGAWRSQFKDLEDRLGRLALKRGLRDKARELGEDKLARIFSEEAEQAQAAAVNALKDSGWWSDSTGTLRQFRQSMAKESLWMDGVQDGRFLRGMLLHDGAKLRVRIRDLEYDRKDIEKGLHELRRELRWLAIQTMNLDGLIRFQEDALSFGFRAWLQEMTRANPEIYRNPYMKLSPPAIANPVLIPWRSFTMLNEIILQLGNLKDAAEMHIAFGEAMERAGFSRKKRKNVLKDLDRSLSVSVRDLDHRSLSRQFQRRLNDSDLLGGFLRQLESMN